MRDKLKSPIVWSVLFSSILAQLEVLQNSSVTPWTVSMALCTVIIAFFGALNNPDDRSKF